MLIIIKNKVYFSGSALVCNLCDSFESWDDCEDNRIIVDCSSVDPEFDVCLKAHRATKSNASETHIYTKRCGYQEQCNGEQCKEYGDWCQVDCCNTNMCNASTPVRAAYLTCLFLGILTAFQKDFTVQGTH